MEKTDRELLIKEISSRLSYEIKVQVFGWDEEKGEVAVPLKVYSINTDGYISLEYNHYDVESVYIEDCLLYLRPLSSMTEEEKNELRNILWFGYPSDDNDRYSHRGVEVKQCLYDDEKHSTYDFGDFIVLKDFLLKNHFDYRGLIEMGLALEAPEGMYK